MIFVIIIVVGGIALVAVYIAYKGTRSLNQNPAFNIPQDSDQQPQNQQPPNQQTTEQQEPDRQEPDRQEPDSDEPLDPAGCFLAGTLVRTDAGLVAVEDVTLGARVISFPRKNPANRAFLEVKGRITQLEDEIIVLSFGTGEIACTSRQKFYVDGRWVAAPQLARGHKLQTHSGSVREVVGVARKRGAFTVFHLFFSKAGHGYTVACSNAGSNNIQVRELSDDPILSSK